MPGHSKLDNHTIKLLMVSVYNTAVTKCHIAEMDKSAECEWRGKLGLPGIGTGAEHDFIRVPRFGWLC